MTSNIYSALVEFRKNLKQPEKNKIVAVPNKYDFYYADLSGVLAAIEEPMQAAGLSFFQTIEDDCLKTVITHTSGELVVSSVPVNFGNKTVKSGDGFVQIPLTTQERGAVITYARRYSLCAAFVLAAEDDTDGNKPEDVTVENVLNEATASVKATLEQAQSLPALSKFLADFVTDNLAKIAKYGNQTYTPKQQEIIEQLQKLNGAAASGEPEKKPSKAEVRKIYSALLAEAKAADNLTKTAEADRKWLDEVKPLMESVLDAEVVADTERQIKGIINDKAAEYNQ